MSITLAKLTFAQHVQRFTMHVRHCDDCKRGLTADIVTRCPKGETLHLAAVLSFNRR